MRERYTAEMPGQIVYDAIHRRSAWSVTYRLSSDEMTVGYGVIAMAGPWQGKPTVMEYYVLPEHRAHVFALFSTLLEASGARLIECQSNDPLLPVMLHTWAPHVVSEKVVFRDRFTTHLPSHGAELQRVNSEEESRACFVARQGGTECRLGLDGNTVATGGVLFHYNHPYGDIYMEVPEPHRRRGFGAYIVQEMKRICYEMGGIPAARCSPGNIASRETLQKAGFVPYAHLLAGAIPAG